MKRQTSADIEIKLIEIINPNGDPLKVLPTDEKSPKNIFSNLTINESINATAISGVLKIIDTNVVGDYFNMVGNEQIKIKFETPDVENSSHDLTFCVTDVRHIKDESTANLDGPSVRSESGWEISFMSCENYLLNWDAMDYMNEDFIGKIAGPDSEGNKGLVDTISEKYFEGGIEIENTHNYIWLKKNHNLYPWGKDVHPPTLGQLMHNLAENAVTGSDKSDSDIKDTHGVNYLFYADLDGYHFKSIRKMIKEGNSNKVDFGQNKEGSHREYVIADVAKAKEGGEKQILRHISVTEYNHLASWNDGAYSSYYELIKPNYDDPYFDYLDFTTKHTDIDTESWGSRKIIDYSYHREQDLWGGPEGGGRVEQEKLLPDKWKTDIKIDEGVVQRKTRRKYDESGLYGYFDSPYNYPSEKSYDFMGSESLYGKSGKQNDILWQTMFDQTILDGKTIKKIQKDIKDPVRENYQAYIQMLNLKEKFNVYRHSICCDEQTIKKFVFLAWVDDARKIQDDTRGGIYEYSWKEVEIWPTDFVEDFKGDEVPVDSRSPLKIVIPEDGMSGKIQEDSDEKYSYPAYNINELLNTTDGDNVFVGPGVNAANDDHNDYPEAYQMMPVGGFFEVGPDGILIDPCELQDNDANGVVDGPWTARGHIVQMYRIPNYILGEINEDGEVVRGAIAPQEPDPEDIDPMIPIDVYFFDVPNAHDGLCGCLS